VCDADRSVNVGVVGVALEVESDGNRAVAPCSVSYDYSVVCVYDLIRDDAVYSV